LCTKVKSFYIEFDEDKELDEWLHLLNSLVNKPENSFKDVFSNKYIYLCRFYVLCVLSFIIYRVRIKFFAENVWYISIQDNLGINTKLTGMTGFSLCDKKVKFTQYPIKSNEQKSVDIIVLVCIN